MSSRGRGYAADTSVPVRRSFEEIERLLTRFGCSEFGYNTYDSGTVVQISFRIRNTDVRMTMQMPKHQDFYRSPTGKPRSENARMAAWEQACRAKWRVLTLAIKAKLALIDEGISTVEREFLADVVTTSGRTVGEEVIPVIERMQRGELMITAGEINGE